MRVYLGLSADELAAGAAGVAVPPAAAFAAAPPAAEAAVAALEEAADPGVGAAAAEVDDPDGPVSLVDVASLHVDLDDSGDLAWFATQEIAAVIELVRR